MSDIPSVADQRTDPDRETTACPNCDGTVREPRSGDAWICDDCARRWQPSELPEVDA
jgi:ribosomal protein L37AE/L43A